jgi:hypothetical protein
MYDTIKMELFLIVFIHSTREIFAELVIENGKSKTHQF